MTDTRAMLVLCALGVFAGCGSEPVGGKSGTGTGNPAMDTLTSPQGFVQKGPLVEGSVVELAELDADRQPTGRTFSTVTKGDDGSFLFDQVELSAPIAELGARGYFYNELTSEPSKSPVELRMLASFERPGEAHVNLNVIGHLTRERVRVLLDKGLPFADAAEQAQRELLDALFIDAQVSTAEALDLTDGDRGAGVLLAVSVILLQAPSEGDLASLLGKLTSDLAADGKLDKETLVPLAKKLVYRDVRYVGENLEAHWRELGIGAKAPRYLDLIDAFVAGMLGTEFAPPYCRPGGGVFGNGPVSCASDFVCSEGHSYAIACDSGRCTCTVDGEERPPVAAKCGELRPFLDPAFDADDPDYSYVPLAELVKRVCKVEFTLSRPRSY